MSKRAAAPAAAPAPPAPPAPPAAAAPPPPASDDTEGEGDGDGDAEGDGDDTTAAVAAMFEIEDGVPLPIRSNMARSGSAYPFDKLGIRQSFFVPVTERQKQPWKTLTSTASRMSRELHPRQFTTARDKKNGVEGVRVWREPDTDKPLAPPRKIERKPRGAKAASDAEAARLAVEAEAGDTSRKVAEREPDFVDGNAAPPPPPPVPPAGAPPAPPAG